MHDAPVGESPHKGKTGLRRVWNAFFYSIDGLRAALRHEDAFRQEVFLAVLLIPAALFMPAAGTGKALTPPAYEPVKTHATRVVDGFVEVAGE